VQEHPQKFRFVKIWTKSLKIWEKFPENLGGNGTQHCLTSRNGAQLSQKTSKTTFGGHTKKTVGKVARQLLASFGKIWQKSFAPPKISSLPHLCFESIHFNSRS